jgi:RimJ/RimL family protein N-acetyltransferase
VITGQSITLREIRKSDIDDRLFFGRPDEFMHMCGGNRNENQEFQPKEVWEQWYQSIKEQPDDRMTWMIEHENRCIGSAGLHHISRTDKNAAFAIGIWDVTKFGCGIGTEATKLVLKYAFTELGLHRVDLKVLDYNMRGIRCYEKCGFKVDGVLRENALIEGEYHSDIVMSILEDEFRLFLK